ncbi:MAG TPA: hypothetical protein VJU87_12040 [Gemmatimonadaceae bacterium]|nr:hypothetical protein [Gemmatimonadaceae bacterium]
MAHLNHREYDDLERAVASGTRIAVWRRGTEYVVLPTELRLLSGREAIEARNPTTGDELTLYLDELDRIEVVG